MKQSLLWAGLLIAAVWPGSYAAAQGIKIGFIDAQSILEKTEEGKRVKSNLEEYLKPRQKITDQIEEELRGMEEELNRQASVLSPEARKSKEEEFRRKLAQYQRRIMELNQEIQSKKVDALKAFNQKLEEAVGQIARKEGYTFVFDKNLEGGALIFAEDRFDLTPQVIEQVDKNAKR